MTDLRSPDYADERDEARAPLPKDPAGRLTPVIEPTEARQATTRLGMRWVLAISLAGAVIAMAIIYFAFFPAPDGSQTALPPAPATSETTR